jgi:3-oxoacyl-[acyl-carrier protein] reductase
MTQYNMNLGLKNKTAIILAASRGLGKVSAETLALEGANIVICARDEKELQEAAKEIQQKSKNKVLAIPCDVTNISDIKNLVEETVKEFGKIDILVNNAGGPPTGTFETITDDQWQKAFELTLMSVIRTIRLVLPHMEKAESGRIINMVSLSVKQPIPNLILSNSIRAGVIGMAKTLSNELAAKNITVNNILTGHFLTDRLKELNNIDEKIKQGQSEKDAWGNVLNNIPMKRLGKPEEYGALVAFLASNQAAYITGASIQIDGGLSRFIL